MFTDMYIRHQYICIYKTIESHSGNCVEKINAENILNEKKKTWEKEKKKKKEATNTTTHTNVKWDLFY